MDKRKTAVINVPHFEAERSLKLMLTEAGYDVYGISSEVARQVAKFMKFKPESRIEPKATNEIFADCDLYAVIKCFDIQPTLDAVPRLTNRLLWFDINGGRPGVDVGYKTYPLTPPVPYISSNKTYGPSKSGQYIRYLPMAGKELFKLRPPRQYYDPPVCLVHNVANWGFGGWVKPLKYLGVKFHGSRTSHGKLSYAQVISTLQTALCYVHVKSRDCPGYSLYQALLSGCPVVVTDEFIRNTSFDDLYVHMESCIVLEDDRSLPDAQRIAKLTEQFQVVMNTLKHPDINRRIGIGGRQRLLELMWDQNNQTDCEEFAQFMGANF